MVIVGDINTSHKEIDHCDPYEVLMVIVLSISAQKHFLESSRPVNHRQKVCLYHYIISDDVVEMYFSDNSFVFSFHQEFGQRPGRKWLDHFLVPSSNPGESAAAKNGSAADDLRTDWMIATESVKVVENGFVDAFRKFHPLREGAFTCWMTR